MRVVSLVPSLTETLIEAGADVVGRTRYCVHPPSAKALPAVGGTKDLDLERLRALRPDLLVLDREENQAWMKDEAPCATHVFHALSVDGMELQTRALAARFEGPARAGLESQAARWGAVARPARRAVWDWDGIPAEQNRRGPRREWENCLYLIWRNPWMTVSSETFIGSVLRKLGAPVPRFETLYPTVRPEDFDPEKTLLLFSSEPFPFARKWNELAELPHSQVLVDGEPYSWFGIRALRFLEARRGVDGL